MSEEIIHPQIMTSIEAVCLAFMLIVVSAYIFLPRSNSLKKDHFFYCLMFELTAVVTDFAAWACETVPSSQPFQYACNFIALIMTNIIVSAFGFYIVEMVREKKEVSGFIANIVAAVNGISVLLVCAGGICGKLFDVKADNVYPDIYIYDTGGFFYDFPVFVSTLTLATLFVYVLCHAKELGKRNIIVFSIYFLLPVITSALELIEPDLQLSIVASSLSLTIVYVLLQSRNMNELMLREKLLNEISYIDALTGLLNRRAFDRDLALIGKDETVSVSFCDLNGLKKVNDEQGHHAGDEYLVSFARSLTKFFPHDSVYRISGDEFVVIARNMDRDTFEKNIDLLKQEINDNSGIAALGTITGSGDAVPALIKQAEMHMYADKKDFYHRNPEYRRGKSAYMFTD